MFGLFVKSRPSSLFPLFEEWRLWDGKSHPSTRILDGEVGYPVPDTERSQVFYLFHVGSNSRTPGTPTRLGCVDYLGSLLCPRQGHDGSLVSGPEVKCRGGCPSPLLEGKRLLYLPSDRLGEDTQTLLQLTKYLCSVLFEQSIIKHKKRVSGSALILESLLVGTPPGSKSLVGGSDPTE